MNQPSLKRAAAACLVTLGFVSGTYAQCDPIETHKLLAFPGAGGD